MKLTPARAALIERAQTALDSLVTRQPVGLPLMELLASLTATSNFAGTGGAATAPNAKSIVNWGAVELQDSIRQEVAERITLLTGEASPRGPVQEELRRLYELSIHEGQPDEQIEKIGARFETWGRQIQLLIEPVSKMSRLPGNCPACEASQARIRDNPGERTDDPEYLITTALLMRGSAAGCRCCGSIWRGTEELRTLSAQLHGSTVVALDAERLRRSEMDAAAAAAQALRAA